MSEKNIFELPDQENWDIQSTDGDLIYTNRISRFEKVKTITFLHYGETEWSPVFNFSPMELPSLESIFIYKLEIPDSIPFSEVDASKIFNAIDEKSLTNVRTIEIYDRYEYLPDWIQHCAGITSMNLSMIKLRELPAWFSQLSLLERLKCYESGLAEFPRQIFGLKNIKELDFSKGHHITVIPDEIKNLQSLRTLVLWNTKFTYVSPELFLLPDIQKINLFATSYPNIPPETMNAIHKLQREKPFIEIWWLSTEKPYVTHIKTLNNIKNQQVMKNKFDQTSIGWRLLTSLKKWLFMVLIFTALLACTHTDKNIPAAKTTAATAQENPKPENEKYTFRIIPAAENTFGYEILDQGKILVQQKTIPAMPGNKGFQTEDDAKKCAGFVISKLNQNIMPPSVTPEELDSLGIFINSKIQK